MRAPLALLFLLSACATRPAPDGGFLTAYEGLAADGKSVRTAARQKRDDAVLKDIRKVAIAPTVFAPQARIDWMSEAERVALLREVDAQLCFEITERYDLAPPEAADSHRVRAAVVEVRPTGALGSVASAAASHFIPGPIGVRAPGSTGGLAAEVELLTPSGAQVAALAWRRTAKTVGTDNPSLSRLGDALQFAEPFADDAAKLMTPKDFKARPLPDPDPCAQFGARLRAEGIAARIATGLYVPALSAAKAEAAPTAPQAR